MIKGIIGKNKRILFTLAVMVILIACSCIISIKISSIEEHTCWDTLHDSLNEVSSEMESRINSDQMLLASIADIIAAQDSVTSPEIQKIIDGFKPNTMISHIALLLPDDKLMLPGEPVRDTDGLLSFETEAAQGRHISDRSVDIRDTNRMILRNYVPVKKDGQVVAMLYGVVDLNALPDQLHITAYDEQAAIYVMDGTSGDFIADTWHNSLGNISEMGSRKVKSGYSHEKMLRDVKEGNAGHCIFVSKSIGDYLYFCYKPTNVNNWSVGISVPEKTAFAKVKNVNTLLLVFLAIEIILLAGYYIYILRSTRKELSEKQRLAERDLLTGLLNRNCFESNVSGYVSKCKDSLTCIYIDVNGLHELNNTKGHAAGDEMLKTVADSIHGEFDDRNVYRIGGDEFVVFVLDGDEDNTKEKLNKISEHLTSCGYHISVGMYRQDFPIDMDMLIKEAEKIMYNNKKAYYSGKGMDRRART